jgi:hypothetical protein
LYDWQLVPIARYADSGNLSCVTLLDIPKHNEEASFFRKVSEYNKGLPEEKQFHCYWANFHPVLADTLIGFNTFLVDAMFIRPVGSSAIYGETAVAPRDVPGYNDGPRFSDMNPEQYIFFRNILDRARQNGYSSYVYTDYGTEMTYDLRDGRIVFDGYPSYQFNRRIIENNKIKEVAPLDGLNKYVEANRGMVNSLNPVIFKTAELTAHWAALFRAIKARNQEVWKEFIKQIKSVPVEPEQQTPRYWIPHDSVPPELRSYLPWKENQPIRVMKAQPLRALPEARLEVAPDRRLEARPYTRLYEEARPKAPDIQIERFKTLPDRPRIELRKDLSPELRRQRELEALIRQWRIQQLREQKKKEEMQ